MQRSVVVTGMGVVCSLGADADELWKGLIAGRSGIGPVTRFDPDRFRSRHAAEIDDTRVVFEPGPLRFEIRRMSGFVRYALFAADRALKDSGIAEPRAGGVYLGVAMGGLPSIEAGVLKQEQEGTRKTSPFLIPSLIPNMAASMIALRHGIEGEQVTVAGACASGCQALGQAMRAIRSGARTWAVAGGAEAVTTPITYSGFEAMRALSRHEDPELTPRPFDEQRDGMVVGEAAAVFVLEERGHAEARGAVIHGELTGFASNSGGQGITGLSSRHITRCMADALTDAALTPDAIDCVFAQASGMVQGDAAELEAVQAATADARRKPVVTSIKGHTGYAFAANGPMNLAVSLMALRHQTVPPTVKLDRTELSFADVDIAREPRGTGIRRCLINAFGFGGINASLVVSRP
ncbi:beta-ketoacyl synthase N-terminal-like domain-containing protein [Streptomyces cupreus]|uniref:Beta-ketoacyl-[acyl-carrier-protein] synthase family protein n=1 Tax=Streptomyces cupreus TaxID=2759956 RepID=A0A7X1J530_9ACTN|nr:beta-ketoacyl-[acyl-carrier-protein] synthase family protein [Streptomyces cupreus]